MSSVGGKAIDEQNDEGEDESENAEGRYKNQGSIEISRVR